MAASAIEVEQSEAASHSKATWNNEDTSHNLAASHTEASVL